MDTTARDILEIGVLLLVAAAAGRLARAAGLSAVLGYLAVGLAVSPFTPGYVADRHQLQVFADIGVVLLLFEVGIEIDPVRLGRERARLLWLAPLQTLLVAVIGACAGAAAGLATRGALIFGLAVALSSSVVVVNITRSRRRTTNTETEQALLGWSMLQDVTGVAVAAGLLASLGLQDRPLWLTLGGIAVFAAVALVAAWLLPHVLAHVHDEPDIFLLVSVSSGLALAGLGAQAFGVPLALAAFVSGLAVTDGPVTAAARQRLLPFRDLFAVLFFVAVGSLIDPAAIPGAATWIGLVLGLALVVKAGSVYGLARLARLPGVRPWQLAAGLGQMGEFSFVLASIGAAERLLSTDVYTAILSGVVLTIAVSTVAVRFGAPPGLAAAQS